ncbi:nuclear transport factor 2 family protein [Spirosoma sp. SC4-14]|uniref:nuclear transport factor 2 family protein n=1 Tax=Spirosoma sp. SC4-14 TaxID=3128900 RepID=UPI0030CF9713
MKTNQQIIEAIYAAFGQGNVPFILETVSEQFTWTDPCNPAIVPYGGTHIGRPGLLTFFQQLGLSTETTLWQVDEYVAGGNTVVATGKHNIRVNATGKHAENDWVMIWHFQDGALISGRSYYDTACFVNAFQPLPTMLTKQ